jgi:hypothetical protein
MEPIILTEKEKELIEAIRNFKKSRHNPSKWLELWIRELFETLLKDDE